MTNKAACGRLKSAPSTFEEVIIMYASDAMLFGYVIVPAILLGLVVLGALVGALVRGWRQNTERQRVELPKSCKLWRRYRRPGTSFPIPAKINQWTPQDWFGPTEEVIGILLDQRLSPHLRLSVRDDIGTIYDVSPEPRRAGMLYKIHFGDCPASGFEVRIILARLTNAQTGELLRDYVWRRAGSAQRKGPDPVVLHILEERARSHLGSL